jgi:hypothetical protein
MRSARCADLLVIAANLQKAENENGREEKRRELMVAGGEAFCVRGVCV